jgi:hypothetical protein
MIQHHEEFLLAKYPAWWGVVPFQLGDRVCVFNETNPGTVTGIMFYDRPTNDGIGIEDLGWWVQVSLDKTADRYRLECVPTYPVAVVQHLEAKPKVSYKHLRLV